MPEASLRALLQRWLPDREIVIARAESGGSTPVYRVTAGREIFFLRLAEEPGERRDAEVRVHQRLRAAGQPVPEIVAWESAPPELDRSAALTRCLPGVSLVDQPPADPRHLARVARAAGRDLARINQVPVRGFGWVETIDRADGGLAAQHPTRDAWAAEYARAGEELAASGLIGPAIGSQLLSVLDRWLSQPDSNASSLCHGDFDVTHIFMAPSTYTYTGIIDFGEIRGADPWYDLGHAWLQDTQADRPPIFPYLLLGYREISPVPDDALLAIRDQAIAIGTRQLAIFLRRSSPHAAILASQLTTILELDNGIRHLYG